MVAFSDTPRLTLPIARMGAVGAALLAVLACVFVPTWRLEALVMRSGLPTQLAAAAPPLGWTARGALALASGVSTAIMAWVTLHLWVGRRQLRIRLPVLARRAKVGPAVRRADAHPDAPPRAPILAQSEFGPTLTETQAEFDADQERSLPTDLATPLAAYASEATAPPRRAAPLAPGERIETFALSHEVPPEHAHSIESLLARLEQGARARGIVKRLD